MRRLHWSTIIPYVIRSDSDLPDAFIHARAVTHEGLQYICQWRYPNVAVFGSCGTKLLVITSRRDAGRGLGVGGAKYTYSMHVLEQDYSGQRSSH
jgi:hypothetical protein